MTRNSYIKCSAYALIRCFLDARCGHVIKDTVAARKLAPPSPTFRSNPFHWGLIAIFGGDEAVLTKGERRLFAHQLLYAHRHDVPVHLLIGFIHQLGRADSVYGKVKHREQEPWLKHVKAQSRSAARSDGA